MILDGINTTYHTAQLIEDALSSVDGSKDAAVEQHPHHYVVPILAQ